MSNFLPGSFKTLQKKTAAEYHRRFCVFFFSQDLLELFEFCYHIRTYTHWGKTQFLVWNRGPVWYIWGIRRTSPLNRNCIRSVWTQNDKTLLSSPIRRWSHGLQSFGLTVMEAEKWRSSNQVEIKILLCKSTL